MPSGRRKNQTSNSSGPNRTLNDTNEPPPVTISLPPPVTQINSPILSQNFSNNNSGFGFPTLPPPYYSPLLESNTTFVPPPPPISLSSSPTLSNLQSQPQSPILSGSSGTTSPVDTPPLLPNAFNNTLKKHAAISLPTKQTRPTSTRPRISRKRDKEGAILSEKEREEKELQLQQLQQLQEKEKDAIGPLPLINETNIYKERSKRKEACELYTQFPELILEFIKNLLFQFQQETDPSFENFKRIWKLNFTHNSFFEGQVLQPDLIHYAYYGILGYLLPNQPLINKVGIIYSLYIFYKSQIETIKVPIIITINLWKKLLEYFDEIKNSILNPEPYHAFKQLLLLGAFQYSSTLHPISHYPIFKTNSTNQTASIIPPEYVNVDTVSNILNLTKLKNIHDKYQLVKKGNNGTNSHNPVSLEISNSNFPSSIDEIFSNDTLSKYEKMLEDKIPGEP